METQFAADSSGFTTSRFIRWYNKKYGREIDNREWVKVHLMCGVNTHVVTSVDVSGWESHDTNYFVPLVEQTARNFHMAEVSADKAYLSHKNLAAIEAVNGTPFIPFKSNTVATTEDSAWGRMYHYFMLRREDFLAHYHRRSNVETVFSMCKAKFGDSVRSKSDTGMVNEVLCKVLCHNICGIQAVHELGVEPIFCADWAKNGLETGFIVQGQDGHLVALNSADANSPTHGMLLHGRTLVHPKYRGRHYLDLLRTARLRDTSKTYPLHVGTQDTRNEGVQRVLARRGKISTGVGQVLETRAYRRDPVGLASLIRRVLARRRAMRAQGSGSSPDEQES